MKPMGSLLSVTSLIVGKSPQMAVPTYAPSSNPFAVLASIDESSDDDLVSILPILLENPFNFVSSVITTQDMMHSLSHTLCPTLMILLGKQMQMLLVLVIYIWLFQSITTIYSAWAL